MKINQPKNMKKKSKSVDGSLNWSPSFAITHQADFDKAQKFIDSECIELMKKYTH